MWREGLRLRFGADAAKAGQGALQQMSSTGAAGRGEVW